MTKVKYVNLARLYKIIVVFCNCFLGIIIRVVYGKIKISKISICNQFFINQTELLSKSFDNYKIRLTQLFNSQLTNKKRDA